MTAITAEQLTAERAREAFEAWWRANVTEFNRLSVTNPVEWERVAKLVDEFQRAHPQ